MNDECHYLVNRQLKIEKFRIFTSDVKKRAITSYDAKRYYTGKLFSIPYFHPDIKVYEEKREAKENLDAFETCSPPHYIPQYFWKRFVEKTLNGQYIENQGELFNDFTAS